MIKIDKTHYSIIAKLLTECFLEDQLVFKQIKGIENPDEFLEKLFLSQMIVLNNTCEIHTLDENCKSVLVGYEKKNYSFFREIVLSILCQIKLFNCINSNDLKIFVQNSKDAKNSVDLKWHREYVKGNYYYIKIIAIAKEYRGRGNLRKLIMPIISMCNEKAMPIVLETNTHENIPIYQHFGFELIRTLPEGEADLYQYCFMKNPDKEI